MLLTKAGRGYNTKYLISRIVTTTRKRSLEQGNVFTGVCLSTERRGMPTGGLHPGVSTWGSASSGGLHPRGLPGLGRTPTQN